MALNLKQWLAGLFGLMLVLALAQGGLALVKLDAVAARTTLLLDDCHANHRISVFYG